jgi:hypothetical protein
MYNEQQSKELWDDLESLPASTIAAAAEEPNPYHKIEASAGRIRQVMGAFEV